MESGGRRAAVAPFAVRGRNVRFARLRHARHRELQSRHRFSTGRFPATGTNDIANAVAFQKDRIVIAGGSLVTMGPPANPDLSVVALVRDRNFAYGLDAN
jgi:hypothetical protein